ncbi:MAG TPA: hypothetical protein VGP68_08765, partial [Gemmataceae bacterium]|nr:hypothetical protein [Gemmataceae bacterium]
FELGQHAVRGETNSASAALILGVRLRTLGKTKTDSVGSAELRLALLAVSRSRDKLAAWKLHILAAPFPHDLTGC